MALPMCTDATRQTAIAAHRAAGTYDMVIVNCGLWESKKPSDGAEGDHRPRLAKHVDRYLSLLAPVAKALVWVTTSAVLGLKDFPQETGRIKKENDAVVDMLRAKAATLRRHSSGPDLFVLDAFKMSRRADMHEDNVHLTTPYYRHLAGLLTHMIQARHFPEGNGKEFEGGPNANTAEG